MLLRRFCALYDAIENIADVANKDRNEFVQTFLVCAEFRYVRYLSLLESFLNTINIQDGEELVHQFSNNMPLPPWYIIHLGLLTF